jgi:hypothetical protein
MIKNLEEALGPLLALQKGAKAAKDRAELIVATRIAESARIAAPGSLGGKISVSQTGEETIIDGGDELSAYVEFGTGQNAEAFLAGKPEEQVAEAKKFFVNGEGTLGAHPFFFPAIYQHREEITEEIEKQLNEITG